MPVRKSGARLRWRGAETVREIAKRLGRHEEALVMLPPGLHHALLVRVGADERAHGLVDSTLDAESFGRLMRIQGLRELQEFREPLERAGMSVRVRTPPPQLLFVPGAEPRKRPSRHHWVSTAALAI